MNEWMRRKEKKEKINCFSTKHRCNLMARRNTAPHVFPFVCCVEMFTFRASSLDLLMDDVIWTLKRHSNRTRRKHLFALGIKFFFFHLVLPPFSFLCLFVFRFLWFLTRSIEEGERKKRQKKNLLPLVFLFFSSYILSFLCIKKRNERFLRVRKKRLSLSHFGKRLPGHAWKFVFLPKTCFFIHNFKQQWWNTSSWKCILEMSKSSW